MYICAVERMLGDRKGVQGGLKGSRKFEDEFRVIVFHPRLGLMLLFEPIICILDTNSDF